MPVNLLKYLINRKLQFALAISVGLHVAIYFVASKRPYDLQNASHSVEFFTFQVTSELTQPESFKKSEVKAKKNTQVLQNQLLKKLNQKERDLPEDLSNPEKIGLNQNDNTNFVTAPQPLRQVIPKLPLHFQSENLKTSVVIEFAVDENGNAQPELVESSENQELDQLAFQAATEWRFAAAIKNGNAVPSKLRLRINFSVK